MRAVVLAAGRGTRMRPLTARRPKVLLPAGPEPLAGRVLRQVADAGIGEATVVVGYGAKQVREALGDGSRWGLDVDHVLQDPPRGTGDALQQAGPLDGDVLVVNGDVVLPDGALADVAGRDGWALACARVDDPTGYGVLDVTDGTVRDLVEKPADPPSDRVNAGAYRVPAGAGDALAGLGASARGEVELTDLVLDAIGRGEPVDAVPVDGWLDVGWPWDLLEAAELVLEDLEPRVEGTVEDGAVLEGPVAVAEGARVRSGAYVRGPAYVGPGCHVGPNCYVRASTVLAGGNRVGNAVEVKNSVLLEGATVGHHAYVGDSVLGRDVNLGAGTKVANLRHDGATVRARVGAQRVDTGRRKMGVVLGDGVHTGINTSLNAGVVLGPEATTLPGETVLRSRW